MGISVRTLVESSLTEFFEEFPELTIGEILYAITRDKHLEGVPEGTNLRWLRQIKDKEFLTAVELAIKDEKNDNTRTTH